MSNRENVIAILFADPDYLGEAGFWFTSDDQAFTEKNKGLGELHAKTLEDRGLVWAGRNLTPLAPSPAERGSLETPVITDFVADAPADAPAPAEVITDAPADAPAEVVADASAEVVVEKKSE